VPGLYLNLGHGSSGWALACGSAQLVANQLGGLVAGSAAQLQSVGTTPLSSAYSIARYA
jgi:D-amino-acid dehydrogenase